MRPEWLLDACRDAVADERRAVAELIDLYLQRHQVTAPRGSVTGREQRAVDVVLRSLLADVLVGEHQNGRGDDR